MAEKQAESLTKPEETEAPVRIERRTGEPNIAKRMLAIMADVQYLQKEHAKGLGFPIMPHDIVTQAIRKSAVKHRVFINTTTLDSSSTIIDRPTRDKPKKQVTYTEVTISMAFINVDNPEDKLHSVFVGAGENPDNKTHGHAYSFAVKTGLLKTFLIPTGECEETAHLEAHMDDDERAERAAKEAAEANEVMAARMIKSGEVLHKFCDDNGHDFNKVISWIGIHHNKSWDDMSIEYRTKALRNAKKDYKDVQPVERPGQGEIGGTEQRQGDEHYGR